MAGLLPARACCQLSELVGIYFGSRGRLLGNPRGRSAYFSLLRNAVARKVVRLGRAVARMEAKYQAVKTRTRMSFFIELALPGELVPAFSQAPVQARPDAACDRKAMLRGLFLGCGSVNSPNTRYHLEFVAPTASWAAVIARMVEESGVKAGITERGGQSVVYVKDGDIIGLDLGCIVEGYYGDCAVTLPVGPVSARAQELLDVTRESLDKAIVQCRPGNRIGDISCAVQAHCESHGFGVVRAFVGHGIGRSLHEDPQVPNFGEAGRGQALKAGMVLAIEPMVTMGSYEVQVLEDGWTAVTVDGSLAAHCEHTVAVTANGPRVLTRREPKGPGEGR